MKSVYLSGPISGLQRKEYMRRFAVAEQTARKLGYNTVNPTRFLFSHPLIYRFVGYRLTLLYDLLRLALCDNIAYLPGNTWSKGSLVEREFAFACGIKETDDQMKIWRAVDSDVQNRR